MDILVMLSLCVYNILYEIDWSEHDWRPTYLFATVWGKIENEHSEERYSHARYDEIDSVEQSLSPHGDVKRDIKVWLITAGVELDVPDGRHR